MYQDLNESENTSTAETKSESEKNETNERYKSNTTQNQPKKRVFNF
jgi:hypothetical protein